VPVASSLHVHVWGSAARLSSVSRSVGGGISVSRPAFRRRHANSVTPARARHPGTVLSVIELAGTVSESVSDQYVR